MDTVGFQVRVCDVKVSCWILRVVGGGPNGVGMWLWACASGEPAISWI